LHYFVGALIEPTAALDVEKDRFSAQREVLDDDLLVEAMGYQDTVLLFLWGILPFLKI